jgi:putative protease
VKRFVKEYKNYEDLPIRNENLKLSVFVDNLELIKAISNFPIHKFLFDPSFSFNSQNEYFDNVKTLLEEAYGIIAKNNNAENEDRLVWVLSSFITDEEIEKASSIVNELKEEGIFISIMYDTPGIAKSFDCDVLGNHNLNVWNSYSVKNLSDSGFKSLILSSELSYGEIKELVTKYQYIKDKDTDLNIIIQGNLEVMSSKDDFSNLNEGRDFIIKDSSDYAILEDQKRKKFKYKVVFDYNRHSHFINKDCLCLIDEIELIKDLGVNTVIIDCRFSGYKYSTQIISLYAQALRKDNNVDLKILKEQIESITMTRLNKGNFINGRIHEKPNKC